MNTELLRVDGLVKHFPIHGGVFNRVVGHVRAVDGVSFAVNRGEVVGLVGESGSGKTTVGRLILRLEQATAGAVRFDGTDVLQLAPEPLRRFRKRMQLVFQDPYASLNPREKVRDVLGHALALHGIGTRGDRAARAVALLEQVGLSADHLERFPHEFSGGQRQRIVIARALAVEPEFLVADEPVSALDVSIQAQVINLLEDLKAQFGLDAALHRPRPGGGRTHLRSCDRDVSGQGDGDRRRRGALCPPGAPLHAGAAVGGAGARSDTAAQACDTARRHAECGQPAVGLRIPHALPAR